MIKIEGENGIILNGVLDIIQERCGLKDRKETLKRVIDALKRDSMIYAVCDMIDWIDQELEIKQREEHPTTGDPDEHVHQYNSSGECEICGAIEYGSPLYREIYGGE